MKNLKMHNCQKDNSAGDVMKWKEATIGHQVSFNNEKIYTISDPDITNVKECNQEN